MIKKLLLFTIASLVMLPALADKPPPKPDKGNKGGGAVPLDVVFRDGIDDKFGSDYLDSTPSGHSYSDGDEPVSTNIGKFRFGLNVGVSGTRNFFLDLRNCIPASSVPETSCTGLPALRLGSLTDVMGFTTGANVFATSPNRAHYLTLINGETKGVDFQLEFLDAGGNDWRIMFNPSKCPKDDINGGDLATMARVKRIADDKWEFEAFPFPTSVACLQLREGGAGNWTFHGLYSLPFKITATAQP